MKGFPTIPADQAPPASSESVGDSIELPRATMVWRFVALAELTNFATLRRHVGKARASVLIDDIAARIVGVLAPAALTVVGRDLIEIELIGTVLEDVDAAFDQLEAAFLLPLDIDGEAHRAEMLFAAAASPMGGIEDVRLAEEAEHALAQARLESRRVVRDTTREPRSVDKITLRRELAEAIEREEVFLQYQPKVHVRRQEVTSAEALVRWNHPRRGLVLPNDFIALAEETQLIGPLTLWTLRKVIADSATITAAGHDLTYFVNISGQLLNDVRFIDEACRLVAEGGAKIGIEITETSVIRDPDSAIRHLQMIAEQGVPIAIDDYGAGLSSLAYLKKLPATELKIDKMFVMELTSSNRDPLIVRSTIDLAHAMEMEVTAEGVESPAALALLTVMGCDLVQGYLLSRPLSLPAFQQYLESGSAREIGAANAAFKRSVSMWKAA